MIIWVWLVGSLGLVAVNRISNHPRLWLTKPVGVDIIVFVLVCSAFLMLVGCMTLFDLMETNSSSTLIEHMTTRKALLPLGSYFFWAFMYGILSVYLIYFRFKKRRELNTSDFS